MFADATPQVPPAQQQMPDNITYPNTPIEIRSDKYNLTIKYEAEKGNKPKEDMMRYFFAELQDKL